MSIHCVNWLRSRNVTVHFVAALLGLFGSGCADDSYRLGGGQQALGTPGKRLGLCADGADFESVDRMEDENGTIDLIRGRSGVWFSFNDKTANDQTANDQTVTDKTVTVEQIPSADAETFELTEIEPPRSGSHYAARTRGYGFTKWGAGIGFELASQLAYDVSRYAGIAFWARRSPDGAEKIRFEVPDSATAPRGKKCGDTAPLPACNQHFGATLKLGPEWQWYPFTWSELTQRSNEEMQPDSVNTREVYGLRFQTDPEDPGPPFDFWIDDIALLCHDE